MRFRLIAASFALTALLPGALCLHAQDDPARRGRKYKPPPDTSHLEVLVLKNSTGKPIANAGVIFHTQRNGKDEGNMEVKSDPDGKADIDIIPTGSIVDIQVIANGYATHAEKLELSQPSHTITVRMEKPKSQVSAYTDETRQSKVGVQEPIRPAATVAPSKPIGASDPIVKLTPSDTATKKSDDQNTAPKQ